MKMITKKKKINTIGLSIWGRNDLMVTAAHRYCLSRSSYIVSDCVEWIIFHWDQFQNGAKELIIRDTKEALDKGWIDHSCDIIEWKHLLKTIENWNIPDE